MSKKISSGGIKHEFKKLINVDEQYLNVNEKDFINVEFDRDNDFLNITINESHFNTMFYTKFYPKYYNSMYRRNSLSRKQLHKHLFEKWQEVIKKIASDYFPEFDICFIFDNPHKEGHKSVTYTLNGVEAMLPHLKFDVDEISEPLPF